MKRIIYILFLFTSISAQAQMGATVQPFFNNLRYDCTDDYLLDSVSNTNISFGLSLRKLKQSYNGYCIEVRRSTDNTTQNIGFTCEGLVDTAAIRNFANGGNVFVKTWYDQSGLNRNAIQATIDKQPEFQFDAHGTFPVIKFDGSNDVLVVGASIQVLTNAGKEGTVFYSGNATKKSQHSFGVLSGTNRWSTHINWVNSNCYFDPGTSNHSPRLFANAAGNGNFDQYTFERALATKTVRKNNGAGFSGNIGANTRTSLNVNMGIGASLNASSISGGHASNSFLELIMYKNVVPVADRNLIELNEMIFWNL